MQFLLDYTALVNIGTSKEAKVSDGFKLTEQEAFQLSREVLELRARQHILSLNESNFQEPIKIIKMEIHLATNTTGSVSI